MATGQEPGNHSLDRDEPLRHISTGREQIIATGKAMASEREQILKPGGVLRVESLEIDADIRAATGDDAFPIGGLIRQTAEVVQEKAAQIQLINSLLAAVIKRTLSSSNVPEHIHEKMSQKDRAAEEGQEAFDYAVSDFQRVDTALAAQEVAIDDLRQLVDVISKI